VERAFASDQLAALRALAADGAAVHGVWPVRAGGLLAGPVQLTAGESRLALGRVQAEVWTRFCAAVAAGPITLAGASRYGRGWVLTFRGPVANLTLLADRIHFLPADGGAAGDSGAPLELLAS
jgi:hypothetical protein